MNGYIKYEEEVCLETLGIDSITALNCYKCYIFLLDFEKGIAKLKVNPIAQLERRRVTK